MAIEEPTRDPMREVTPLLIEVQSNLHQELSLESLARQYGYSPYHFHRFFSRAEVLRPAARDQVPVVDERLVQPRRAGVDQVVAQARPGRQTPAV